MKSQRSRNERPRPWSRFGPMDFAVWLPVTFLFFLGFGALLKHLPPAVPLAYATCSLLSAAFYAHDKSRAQRDEWRTPESALHLLDLLGGWPGGLIAQRVFRHKTRKLSFQAIFWLCVAGHVILWSWIFVAVPAEVDLVPFLQRVARAAGGLS